MRRGLTTEQQSLLDAWLPGYELVADRSWPLQDTTVLQVQSRGRDFIVKASLSSHHIEREIAAHESGLIGLRGRVPTLVNSSVDDRILLAEYLPGTPVEGTLPEWDPDTYFQAGSLLARLFVPGQISTTHVSTQVASMRANLSKAICLLSGPVLNAFERQVDEVVDEPAPMFFTHGDYQPRNWLIHDGELRVIDFGRAAQRHWTSDLVRLRNQQLLDHPELADAFTKGLARPMTALDQRMLHLASLQEAIGTVVWAHHMGDHAFLAHGQELIDRLIEEDHTGRAEPRL